MPRPRPRPIHKNTQQWTYSNLSSTSPLLVPTSRHPFVCRTQRHSSFECFTAAVGGFLRRIAICRSLDGNFGVLRMIFGWTCVAVGTIAPSVFFVNISDAFAIDLALTEVIAVATAAVAVAVDVVAVAVELFRVPAGCVSSHSQFFCPTLSSSSASCVRFRRILLSNDEQILSSAIEGRLTIDAITSDLFIKQLFVSLNRIFFFFQYEIADVKLFGWLNYKIFFLICHWKCYDVHVSLHDSGIRLQWTKYIINSSSLSSHSQMKLIRKSRSRVNAVRSLLDFGTWNSIRWKNVLHLVSAFSSSRPTYQLNTMDEEYINNVLRTCMLHTQTHKTLRKGSYRSCSDFPINKSCSGRI